MNFRRSVFGVFVALVLVGSSAASGGEATVVKFQLLGRHLVIVRGGIGQLEELRFLIDTGAMPTMVDRKIAKKLSVPAQEMEFVAFGKAARVATAVLPEIRIGNLKFKPVTAGIADLSFARGVDAIIGIDVLSRHSFSINYNERQLTFGPVSPGGAAVRLDTTPPFLAVQIKISGQPFRLWVDTGSGRLVLFQNRIHNRLPVLPVCGELLITHLAGTSKLNRVLLPSVEVGDSALGRLEGFISDASVSSYPPGIDGVLGVRALSSKSVGFDFERNRLVFGP